MNKSRSVGLDISSLVDNAFNMSPLDCLPNHEVNEWRMWNAELRRRRFHDLWNVEEILARGRYLPLKFRPH